MRFFNRALMGLFLTALTAGLLAVAGNTVYGALQARWAEEGRPPSARERVFSAEVGTISVGSVTPFLTAFGEIRPRRTLALRAPPERTLLALPPGLEEGGPVPAGQWP